VVNERRFVERSARFLPSQIGPTEALMRAAEYRQMAATATLAGTRDALLRLARRYERLAVGTRG
jgi:hypothetical protein